MKKLLALWLLLLLFGFLPPNIKTLWIHPTERDLLITIQQCGCPCPTARILKGKMDIPPALLQKHPTIHQSEMNLEGNISFGNGNYELLLLDYVISGEVVGVDTILCEPNSCEVAPKFEVEEAIATSYLPRFWAWENRLFAFGYLLIVLIVGGWSMGWFLLKSR